MFAAGATPTVVDSSPRLVSSPPHLVSSLRLLRITDLEVDFHTMTARYSCDACRTKFQTARRLAEAMDLVVFRSDIDAAAYTFMGWDPKSSVKLTHGRGSAFPAFLTARGGVSNTIVDMMRPLFNAGVKPETFSRMVLELQAKTHTRRHVEYEHGLTIMRAAAEFDPRAVLELFSSFADKTKYAGMAPTGSYSHRQLLHVISSIKRCEKELLHVLLFLYLNPSMHR